MYLSIVKAFSPALLLSKVADISASPRTSPRQSTPGQDYERHNLPYTSKNDEKRHRVLPQLPIDLMLANRQTPATVKIETSSTKVNISIGVSFLFIFRLTVNSSQNFSAKTQIFLFFLAAECAH